MEKVLRAKPLLGSFVEIFAEGDFSPSDLNSIVSKAFNEIHEIEKLMSVHLASSEVSLLNREASYRAISVDFRLCEVIKRSLEISSATMGLFDISASTHWSAGDYRDIEVGEDGKIFFKADLNINLSGIAKGYAVDRATELLIKEGIESGSVNAGGDLRIFGEAQIISIRDPRNPSKASDLIELENGAIATSSGYFSVGARSLKEMSNTVDPGTREVLINPNRSVSIIADECIIADALTKVASLSYDVLESVLNKFEAKALFIEALDKELNITRFEGTLDSLPGLHEYC